MDSSQKRQWTAGKGPGGAEREAGERAKIERLSREPSTLLVSLLSHPARRYLSVHSGRLFPPSSPLYAPRPWYSAQHFPSS